MDYQYRSDMYCTTSYPVQLAWRNYYHALLGHRHLQADNRQVTLYLPIQQRRVCK